MLNRLGVYEQARPTADRARTLVEVSGSPPASAVAAWPRTVVLRHQDRAAIARRLMATDAAVLEAAGGIANWPVWRGSCVVRW